MNATTTMTSASVVSAELPRSVLNRALYSDGFNLSCFLLCARPNGATIAELRKLAASAKTSLALRFEPIVKHSRADGKRGLRWDVAFNGATVNKTGPVTMAQFKSAPDTTVVSIRNVRAVAVTGFHIDSHGKRSMGSIVAPAPVATIPAPVATTPAPVATTPAKSRSKSRAKK